MRSGWSEINFNRYLHRYTPSRPLGEIDADIRAIEKDILRILSEVTGSGVATIESSGMNVQ